MKYVDGPSDGHKVVNNNLFLLHYMKGSITDVNIWRGIMKEKDMFDWMNCKSSDGDGGDIIMIFCFRLTLQLHHLKS